MRLKPVYLLACLLVGAFLLVALAEPDPLLPHPYFAGKGFLVIAHRGGRQMGPENTLPLFRRAVELGVDALEMDVRQSADDTLVVLHDATVDRTTEGTGRVDSLTLEQLKSLDAGHAWTADGQTHPWRGQGIRIPTLAEVFRAFPEQRFIIEIKADDAQVVRALCATVRDFGMQDRVLAASFHEGALDAFRALCPEVATSAASAEVTWYWLGYLTRLGALYTPAFCALQVPRRFGPVELAAPRFVERAKARGLLVHVWTVDEEKDMERLLDLGVDGIMTDRPDRLLALLRRRGQR